MEVYIYIVIQIKKKEEAYTNLNSLNTLTNTNVPDINYPTESVTISSKNENSVRQYNGQGQSTDVFLITQTTQTTQITLKVYRAKL